jgi:tRNA(Ile)-lysidine synthase
MLGISRKELETFLIENEKVWREDSTNKDISFFRNRLRRNIIPELNLILPGSLEHIALLSSEISEVNRYIQNRAKKFFQLNFCDNCIRIPKKAPKLLVREVIKAFLFESGNHCYVNRKNINSLLVLCRSGKPGRVMLGEDKVVYFYDDKLVYENFAIEKKSGERLLFLDEVVRFGNIEAVLKDSVQEKTGDYCFWIDPAIVSGDLVVRYRRPGDRLLIKNSAGRKKVSDLFIDKKIPVFRREKVVLFCDSEKVLFVPGITCGRGVLESPKDGYLCVSVKTLKE